MTILHTNQACKKFDGMITDHAINLINLLDLRFADLDVSGLFVESGTYRGKSACLFLNLNSVRRGILVDIAKYLQADELEASTAKKFTFVQAKSETLDYKGIIEPAKIPIV